MTDRLERLMRESHMEDPRPHMNDIRDCGICDDLRREIAAALLKERQIALLEAKAACEDVALSSSDAIAPIALECANRVRALRAAIRERRDA